MNSCRMCIFNENFPFDTANRFNMNVFITILFAMVFFAMYYPKKQDLFDATSLPIVGQGLQMRSRYEWTCQWFIYKTVTDLSQRHFLSPTAGTFFYRWTPGSAYFFIVKVRKAVFVFLGKEIYIVTLRFATVNYVTFLFVGTLVLHILPLYGGGGSVQDLMLNIASGWSTAPTHEIEISLLYTYNFII